MKTLYIVRHAQAAIQQQGTGDFERILTADGRQEALNVGKRLFEAGISPNCIVTSSAFRTLTTARILAGETGYPSNRIRVDMRLYNAALTFINTVVEDTNDTIQSLMIVGHNPGMHEYCNYLLDSGVPEFPPASVAVIELPIDSWMNLEKGTGKLILLDQPE
jgi:phosphohistidine phosphatase